MQKFSDYRFPPKIARRLFSPEILSSKNRHLVGGVLTHSEILKQGTVVSEAESLDRLFTRITFKIRPDASIFYLPFFQNKKKQPLVRGMSAEIGLGLVRFGKVLHPENYPFLLNHLGLISRGEQTHCIKGKTVADPEVEQDSDEFDFLDNLHPVDFTQVPQLEKALVNLIYLAVTKGEPFPPLDFCHKNRSDYFHGIDHQIWYKNKSFECPNSFMAVEMIDYLKNFEGLAKANSEDVFVKELAEVLVSFRFQGKTFKDPFIDYLEGEFRLENGDVYWRLHKMWYEVRADYLGIIHQDFGRLVQKTLLGNKDLGSLQNRWPSPNDKDKRKAELRQQHQAICQIFQETHKCNHKVRYDIEAEYNQSYLSKKNFLLGDKICPQGIELFDILHYDPTHLYLYHVKEEFGQKTRDACSQIFNAAKLIHTLKQRPASNIVTQFYREAVGYSGKESYRTQVKEKVRALGEEGFRALFKKRVVFVYAFADTSTTPRFLEKDKNLRTRITSKDIEKANNKFKKQGQKIFDALVKEKYLTLKGHLTSKFLGASAENFTLEMLTVDNQLKKLYKQLANFSSQFDSTIAKLELLRLDQDIEKLGFQLRICQIHRTDYPPDLKVGAVVEPKITYAPLKELPELEEVEMDQFRITLSEEDDFTHEDDEFHICTTEADGACGLHSILGTKKNRVYVYNAPEPNKTVREVFTKALRGNYEDVEEVYTECLVDLLKDYLGSNPSSYVKEVFDPIREEMSPLIKHRQKNSAKKIQFQEAQEKLFYEILHTQNKKIQKALVKTFKVTSLDVLENDPYRRSNAFRNNLDDVMAILEGTDEKQRLSQIQQSINQLDEELDKLYADFVQNEFVLDSYIQACEDETYYFSTQELRLAAHLFDKRVLIYAHQHLDQVFDPMEYGDEDDEEVIIFHKGMHFSRCERI